MGFCEGPLVKEYNNQRIHDTIGSKEYDFRSKLDWRIAKYLQFLKTAGEIKDWWYEQTTFKFPDDTWLVDFDIRNNNDTLEYWEGKGLFEADTRRKLKLLNKYQPEVKITMVFNSKNNAKKVKLSKKYLNKICILTKNGIQTILDKSVTEKFNI
ncbi:MAG: hypothetical protein PHG53_09645 [Phycisphaerae bacterium]|nr:hypothetical protein [Phycisphaerae bacterium]